MHSMLHPKPISLSSFTWTAKGLQRLVARADTLPGGVEEKTHNQIYIKSLKKELLLNRRGYTVVACDLMAGIQIELTGKFSTNSFV